MLQPQTLKAEYPYGEVGNFDSQDRRDVIVQSLWTKPITDKDKLKKILYLAALSLAYAHNSGYIVHMHTDAKGAVLLKNYGYDKLLTTLDYIPKNVPIQLFAAGKYYAMKAEGLVGKVHIDVDVFLKRPGILDCFYHNKSVDVICQQEEDMRYIDHADKIVNMCIMGYPDTTRPDWYGSMNTGVIGFHNERLAEKYFGNYRKALAMYTASKFEEYKKKSKCEDTVLLFDFILEQVTLSCMSTSYNVKTLVPKVNPCEVADAIGYQHLQGDSKWERSTIEKVKQVLLSKDRDLLKQAQAAAHLVDKI